MLFMLIQIYQSLRKLKEKVTPTYRQVVTVEGMSVKGVMTLQQRESNLCGQEEEWDQERFITRDSNLVWSRSILGLLDRGRRVGNSK